MSTIKTVLTTAAVLTLGAVIAFGYQVAVYQQERIDSLQAQISGLQDQAAAVQTQVRSVQKQTAKDDARLNRTIKTTNKNFDTVSGEQDELRKAILGLVNILKSLPDTDSTPAPTNFTRSSNGL